MNFYIGGFTPRALDARPDDDVLVQNGAFLSTLNRTRGIDIGEFNRVTVGGEWLFAFSRHLEGGLGIGFYQRAVPTLYTDLVNTDGTDIEQTLKLRIIPFTATVRLLPFGHDQADRAVHRRGCRRVSLALQRNGADFVDSQSDVFPGNFVGSGAATGPVILGGVRVPAGPVGAASKFAISQPKANCPSRPGLFRIRRSISGASTICS